MYVQNRVFGLLENINQKRTSLIKGDFEYEKKYEKG